MARDAKTQTVFRKPPTYSPDELKQRRQVIGLEVMGLYKRYGWLQPVGNEWLLEVTEWATALAFIPTSRLAAAFQDAKAQPWAPKPITSDFVMECYNGLPGQGYMLVNDESHRPYVPDPPRQVLALPMREGDTLPDVRAVARQRAEEAAAIIQDPQLRECLTRLAARAMLPREVRLADAQAFQQQQADADLEGGRPMRHASLPQGTTSGKEYLAQMKQAADLLPPFVRDGVKKYKETQTYELENENTEDQPAEGATAPPRPTRSQAAEGAQPRRPGPPAGRRPPA